MQTEEPQRTCIGCRAVTGQSELVRYVLQEGAVVADPQRKLPGRGAWLHPDPVCWDRAGKRRSFQRALRAGWQ